MPPTFIIGVAAVLAWAAVARLWLPVKGVRLLQERWVGLPRAKREIQRQVFALGWSVAQTAVFYVLLLSAGIGAPLAAGRSDALGALGWFSALGFGTGYVWFLLVSLRANRAPGRPA